jgi:hypothetical protein
VVVFVTNRKGKIVAEVFEQLVLHLGAAAASAWMPSAYDDLNGLSPHRVVHRWLEESPSLRRSASDTCYS